MLEQTRCAIAPFRDSSKPITSEIMIQVMTQWARLASAVESEMQLKKDMVLIWSLSLTGGSDKDGDLPLAHARIELCKEADLPCGAYLIHSASSSYQGTLVRISYSEITILTNKLAPKGGVGGTIEEVATSIVHDLCK